MVDPTWSWTFAEQIESSKNAGHETIEKLLKALTDSGWDGMDFFHVQMAAEEAMINAVTHGNGEAPDKVVEVEFRVSPTRAYLRFKDEGEGFNPDDLPDPRDDDHLECTNGRGVLLIKEMMTEVKYNECGNEVIMVKEKRLEPQSESA